MFLNIRFIRIACVVVFALAAGVVDQTNGSPFDIANKRLSSNAIADGPGAVVLKARHEKLDAVIDCDCDDSDESKHEHDHPHHPKHKHGHPHHPKHKHHDPHHPKHGHDQPNDPKHPHDSDPTPDPAPKYLGPPKSAPQDPSPDPPKPKSYPSPQPPKDPSPPSGCSTPHHESSNSNDPLIVVSGQVSAGYSK